MTKLKKEKFNIDPEMLRPYFKAENVIDGIFNIANKLYGIKFKELHNLDTWHKEVTVYEVLNDDDSLNRPSAFAASMFALTTLSI